MAGSALIETPALRELAAFSDKLTAVPNVMALMQNTDLRILINKSEQLQRALTFDLPDQPPHGFLWSGDFLPDIEQLLRKSVTVSECIIFQSCRDPEPDLLQTPFAQFTSRLEVYNWWIFRTWSFQTLLAFANHVRRACASEVDVDQAFKELSSASADFCGLQPLMAVNRNYPSTKRVLSDKNISLLSSRMAPAGWQRILLNSLTAFNQSSVWMPFATSRVCWPQILFAGQSLLPADSDYLKLLRAEIYLHLTELSSAELQSSINTLSGQILQLLHNSDRDQTDLFNRQLSEDFADFRREKADLEKALQDHPLLPRIKEIMAAVFLISTGKVTPNKLIRKILLLQLVHLLQFPTGRSRKKTLADKLKTTLRQFYLDHYVLNKILPLSAAGATQTHPLHGDALKAEDIDSETIDTVFIFMPCLIKRDNPANCAVYHFLVGKDFDQPWQEQVRLGSRYFPAAERVKWQQELQSQGPTYHLLGDYARSLLSQMTEQSSADNALTYFRLWVGWYYLLLELKRVLKPGASGALIFNAPHIRLNGNYIRIDSRRVFEELIARHGHVLEKSDTLPVTLSTDSAPQPEHNNMSILIIKKRKLPTTTTQM